MNAVEIHDKNPEGYLSFDLRDVLRAIASASLPRFWSILDMEATSDTSLSISDLSARIQSSRCGATVSWDELVKIAASIDQTVNATIVGTNRSELLSGTSSPKLALLNCDVVIEAVDSSFWLVRTKDQAILKRIKNKFLDVRETPDAAR